MVKDARFLWLLGLLVAVFALSACDTQPTATQVPAEEPVQTEEPAAEATEPMAANAVEVQDQELGEDNTVTVPVVSSEGPGWLVIHADSEGAPGPVIGFSQVPAGESANVLVEIDAAGATDTLYAMLHIDAGTEGEYEFPGDDAPARDTDDNVVVKPFAITRAVANAVEVADQALGEGFTVNIPGVTSDGPGWLVIHRDNEGAPGPVIGFAQVAAGENSNVVVEVDPAGLTGTLYAMLHIDAGTEGEYEFPGDDVPAKDAEDNVVVKPFAVTANAVGVGDQPLVDGKMVTVARVLSEGPGWLVIHADNEGAPGPILGYAQVAAGFNPNVAVEIDPAGVTGTLYAMLHVDAGTEGEYEFPGDDAPAKDVAGNVVTPAFNVLSNSVAVADQELGEGNSVTVPEIVSETPGWMVIHADNDGAPGPVIGFAQVAAGISRDVVVEIDPAGATETLYAMLHVDAGAADEYEFPGDDVPARDPEGNVVVKPFVLSGATAMTGGEEVMVTVADSRFSEKEISVAVGMTVVWTNSGGLPHTVTADEGLFDSGTLNPGDTFSFTFDEPGTYAYHCDFHGSRGGSGMSGVITVTES